MRIKYTAFNKYVFRSPLFDIISHNNEFRLSDPIFNEALWLASPAFYQEKSRIGSNPDILMKIGLYKYLTRAALRCTPFGLFAGCSLGKVGDKIELILVDKKHYQRITRLDMNFLCTLVHKIESLPLIQNQLKFYPNDSIYFLGGKLRYVEYSYLGSRRIHNITSVDVSDYIVKALREAEAGNYCHKLATSLIDEEIGLDSATEFIEELISSQLLKSELEVCVTGKDPLEQLINKLSLLKHTQVLVSQLSDIKDLLCRIDQAPIGETINLYDQIVSIINNVNVEYDIKYLFQVDLFKPTRSAIISKEFTEGIIPLIYFLNKITPRQVTTNLTEFCRVYYERYGDREMPLLQVLDTELGIGFLQNRESDTTNELIGGIVAEKGDSSQRQRGITISKFDELMLKKYVQCIKDNTNLVILDDFDLVDGNDEDLDDLPSTLSVMCNIMEEGTYIRSVGGSCAANLLGRFCHLDPGLELFAKEITEKDQELNPDVILAEIVHLPEDRIGNILLRPVLRDYEIHYLSNSKEQRFCNIPLTDLLISIENNRILLKSKKLGKEIIPRLTTAHNFSFNALPIYQFLCELQTQNLKSHLYFRWNEIFNSFNYRPRVMYKNFILARQQWFVESASFQSFSESVLKEYLTNKHIPLYVIIPEGDNELFIDFNNSTAIELFISLLKKRKAMWIEEFLFPKEGIIIEENSADNFCNEFVFAYYKTI